MKTAWLSGLLWLIWVGTWQVALADLPGDPKHWRWSNPRPHGNNVVAMAWSAAVGMVVQVTERGGIYTSQDLDDWVPRMSGTDRALRGVAFFGGRIVITGEEGTVLYGDTPEDIRVGQLANGETGDWLEAVTVSDSLVVAVGDQGAIYTSDDGAVWRRETSGVTDWLRGVAYGEGRFVAVGEDGTILSSANGVVWSRVASGTSVDLNRVSFGSDRFMAVGDAGVVLTSANGLDWDEVLSGAAGDLYDAVAVGPAWLVVGDNEVRIFEGAVWHDELAGGSGEIPPWVYYTAIGGSSWFLVAGRTGMLVEGHRVGAGDYEWRLGSRSARTWLFDVTEVTGLYVAVGDRATVLTSGTGVDWSIEGVPTTLANAIFLGVGGTTNLLVAAGNQGSLMISPHEWIDLVVTNGSGTVVTQAVSTLGVVWHAVEPRPATVDLQGVTYHEGQYYVTGDAGLILASVDGTNWTQRVTPTTRFLSGITGFGAGLVASGEEGTLLHSVDGVVWTGVTSETSDWLYRVRLVNGQLLAVGQNGVMLTSSNGLDWVSREGGGGRWLNDATWVGGRYYVVGVGGTVLISEDGVNWTNVGTRTGKSLSGVATDGARLVVAGVEGVILRSSVVPDLTPIQMLDYMRMPGVEPGTVQNLFLFGGRVDQQFRLDHGDRMGSSVWAEGPTLEFRQSDGTLSYLETWMDSLAPPEEYYRGRLLP